MPIKSLKLANLLFPCWWKIIIIITSNYSLPIIIHHQDSTWSFILFGFSWYTDSKHISDHKRAQNKQHKCFRKHQLYNLIYQENNLFEGMSMSKIMSYLKGLAWWSFGFFLNLAGTRNFQELLHSIIGKICGNPENQNPNLLILNSLNGYFLSYYSTRHQWISTRNDSRMKNA